MDALIETLGGARYRLSQYDVLVTGFEDMPIEMERNSKQLAGRNGSLDFGGWHKSKKVALTGYLFAPSQAVCDADLEQLRGIMANPDGFYITRLMPDAPQGYERPGETQGEAYSHLDEVPDHKRYLVVCPQLEQEFVGSNGTKQVYKLSAELETKVLPYGETVAEDINLPGKYANVPINLLMGTATPTTSNGNNTSNQAGPGYFLASDWKSRIAVGDKVTVEFDWVLNGTCNSFGAQFNAAPWQYGMPMISPVPATGHFKSTFTVDASVLTTTATSMQTRVDFLSGTITVSNMRVYPGTAASWSPNPSELAYDVLDGTAAIPYVGTVLCKQVEQGFVIEYKASAGGNGFQLTIGTTSFTYAGTVVAGDTFVLSGYSYTKNGINITKDTNKAYFTLRPDVPNTVACTIPGKVRVLGFQDLYA